MKRKNKNKSTINKNKNAARNLKNRENKKSKYFRKNGKKSL